MSGSEAESPVTPQRIYENRRAVLRSEFESLDQKDRQFATARGIVFLSSLVLLWLIFQGDLRGWWLLVPTAIFGTLMVWHARVARSMERTRRAISFYDRALDRLADRWAGVGVSGQRYVNHQHAYSSDLDIFGDGSLFQLLCGSRTRLGEDLLAAWLSDPAEPQAVRERQQAVRELQSETLFREELALLDAEVHDELDQNKLRDWVKEAALPFSMRSRITALCLGLAGISTFVYWLIDGMISPLLIVIVIDIIFYLRHIADIRHIAQAADDAGSGLAILGQVLQLIETRQFQSTCLARARRSLDVEGHVPSWQIPRLQNLIQNLNACLQNQFFAPLSFICGLPIEIAHRVEMWREHVGPHIPNWLQAVAEIETLTSLSGYAYEHPQDVFPELAPESEGACLDAAEIGHPLIPLAKCIRNDVKLNREMPLIMVSGSNMSGKSTLLRTIGINAVLAWSGAPVRASRLRISRLQVGTEMRIHDSLQHGVSLFYSVISRLKTVVELAGKSPTLLFLLDEILQGTNSHDRRVGAEGIIKQLIERGAFGLVTTHDLALTKIVDAFRGRAINIHFEDHLINGKMYFDHRIRQGIVRKSNALELMRMIGLDVPDDGKAFDSE